MITDHQADVQVKEVLGASPAWVAFVSDDSLRNLFNTIAIKEAMPPASVQPVDHLQQALKSGLEPQVIIVDFTTVADVVQEAKTLLPLVPYSSQIILIGTVDNIAIYRELKRLGVTDYLSLPLSDKMIEDAVIDAAHMPPRSKLVNTKEKPLTVIMSARGGCGASTLAVNMAWLTANTFKKKVCLVDMDLYNGSIAVLLDLPANTGINDALAEAERLDETFLKRLILQKEENLYILTGQIKLGQEFTSNPDSLNKLFTLLRDKFDYIFVDLSASYQSPMAQALLGMADKAIIVTDLSLVSVQGVLRLKSFLSTYFATLKYKIVANNLFPQGGTVSKGMFEKGIDSSLDENLPFCKAYMLEGINAGEPFVKTKADHAYSKQLLHLITQIYPQLESPVASQPFYMKWLRRNK